MNEPTESECLAVAQTLCHRPWSQQTRADREHYLAQAHYRLRRKADGLNVALLDARRDLVGRVEEQGQR